MTAIHRVQPKGICNSLSVFLDTPGKKDLATIINGANGISGQHMLLMLMQSMQSSQRWSKIFCLLCKPPVIPDGLLLQAEHIPLDFLKSSDDAAALLKAPGVRSDYAFFYWYIPMPLKPSQELWSNAKRTATVNITLLSEFLGTLSLADVKPPHEALWDTSWADHRPAEGAWSAREYQAGLPLLPGGVFV